MLHGAEARQRRTLHSSRVRRWLGHLFREWTTESWRPIAPAFAKPSPANWSDTQVTFAWIGHATVLINFFGVKILTDPVLFPRVGIRLPGFTIGPKRLTAAALQFHELPSIDLILLSHAHFDHFDLRTLRCFSKRTTVITARATSDLLRHTRFGDVTELDWGEAKSLKTARGEINVRALPVNHWGARKQRDTYRGYNGYLLERNGRRIIFSGDTAMTDSFAETDDMAPSTSRSCRLALITRGFSRIVPPSRRLKWQTPQARASSFRSIIKRSDSASNHSREPIEHFKAALGKTPERIALREIGETFVLPL